MRLYLYEYKDCCGMGGIARVYIYLTGDGLSVYMLVTWFFPLGQAIGAYGFGSVLRGVLVTCKETTKISSTAKKSHMYKQGRTIGLKSYSGYLFHYGRYGAV